MSLMFEPHEDRRAAETTTRGWPASVLGFVLGFGIGWLAWFALIRPALTSEPTADNPSGEAAGWIYYGSLIATVVLALFIVAVVGEWIGSRRRKDNPAA